MPTCRRKRVVLTEPSTELACALESDPEREVFYLEETGEIFETYESVPTPSLYPCLLTFNLSYSAYAARMSFYRLKQFQCEVTGKSGLDYFQAVESERQEARTMHARFSEPLKCPVLRAVQWRMSSITNHLSNNLLNVAFKRLWGVLTISLRLSLNVSKIAISRTRVRPGPTTYSPCLTVSRGTR